MAPSLFPAWRTPAPGGALRVLLRCRQGAMQPVLVGQEIRGGRKYCCNRRGFGRVQAGWEGLDGRAGGPARCAFGRVEVRRWGLESSGGKAFELPGIFRTRMAIMPAHPLRVLLRCREGTMQPALVRQVNRTGFPGHPIRPLSQLQIPPARDNPANFGSSSGYKRLHFTQISRASLPFDSQRPFCPAHYASSL